MNLRYLVALLALCVAPLASPRAVPELPAKLAAQALVVERWAADPAIVAAVRAHNSGQRRTPSQMTQQQWTALPKDDPLVQELATNSAATALRAHRTPLVSEAFVSGADGTKVGFLAKPSTFTHKGKAKHDVPMRGERWYGDIEVDESTGLEQVQLSVPVLDAGTPIGSLVVGLDLSKLILGR
jgi:hypothetical protein